MAKKKPAGKRPDKQKKDKKGFWSNFFEPVPEEKEQDGFFDARREEQASTPPEALFSEDEPVYSDAQDAADAGRLRWDDGAPVVSDPYSSDGPIPQEKPLPDEPIRLFDDGDTGSFARQDTNRTRIFKTGQTTTTRIHMNNTEEAQRRAEAARLAREREAKRRHEEYIERQNRKKKRRANLRKLFGNIAFVVLIFVGILVALYYTFLLSDIVVTGNEAYSSQYIIDLSGLKIGRHMLLCDMDRAAENISSDPYLQVDGVTYIFPSRIRIAITERKEIAGIIGLNYNVIIDRNGYVLAMGPGVDLSGLIQVSGASLAGFQVGERLGQGDDFSTATLVNLIAALEQQELVDDIASIDLTTPLAVTMRTQNGLTVFIGQPTDLEAKTASLAKLLPRFVSQSISAGTLYLSAKGGTVYSPSSDGARLPVPVTTDTPAEPVYAEDGSLIPPAEGGDGDTGDGDGTGDVPASTTAGPANTPTPAAATPAGGDDPFSG